MLKEKRGTAGHLKRTLTLPWLVFYGVGVTIGAGIFALIGEVLALAGDQAPLSFLLAGTIAGITGISYAVLIQKFPKAGGEAVFVNRGLGRVFARLTGYGVVATGIISSGVIALAFAGYIQELVPLPQPLLVIAVIAVLSAIAWYGVRESIYFAAAITVLELGTLLVVIFYGLPLFGDLGAVAGSFTPTLGVVPLAGIASGGVLAFFAFIGFEDIENMCEETLRPEWTVPRAIFLTLGITVFVYVLLAVIASLAEDRQAIVSSTAPLARLYESVSGLSGKPVAAAATIAMINGILVQIVMASRVLYGMANEGLAPMWLAKVDSRRQTPVRATLIVAAAILMLTFLFPLVRLAEATSLVTLGVFALVNLALFRLGGLAKTGSLHRYRWWGLAGACLCLAIAFFQIGTGLFGGH
ncbi:APC family permease [Roseibium marinum]|uniref:Amino acid transporter n=1 Tax=Roseibium marinum TaxID=281252 RepID=A0A2S3UMH0_9HYPH|nr:amino acid permease [Roseibium marinum]POF28896.1 amino acid transporter [Roseibium marinum]